jgi:hypothetical protein
MTLPEGRTDWAAIRLLLRGWVWGQRAEVRIDRFEIVVGQIAKTGPRHDLQERPIFGVCHVEIYASSYDLPELRKSVPLWQPVRFRSEVP